MRHVNSYKNPGFNLGSDDSGLLNEVINGIEDFLSNNVEGDQINPEDGINGTYNFFVRGVDRIDNGIIEFLASSMVFGGADQLWLSFQNGVSEFINKPVNPNNAIKLTPIKNRPQWDKVNDVLNGDEPISILGCE